VACKNEKVAKKLQKNLGGPEEFLSKNRKMIEKICVKRLGIPEENSQIATALHDARFVKRENEVSFYPNHTQYTTSVLCVCFVRYLVVVVVVVVVVVRKGEAIFLCGSEYSAGVYWKHPHV
jgi:hypothetical protein